MGQGNNILHMTQGRLIIYGSIRKMWHNYLLEGGLDRLNVLPPLKFPLWLKPEFTLPSSKAQSEPSILPASGSILTLSTGVFGGSVGGKRGEPSAANTAGMHDQGRKKQFHHVLHVPQITREQSALTLVAQVYDVQKNTVFSIIF